MEKKEMYVAFILLTLKTRKTYGKERNVCGSGGGNHQRERGEGFRGKPDDKHP